MSRDWYLFTPPQVKNSGFEKDEFVDFAEDSFAEVLEESFLGVDVVLYRNGNMDENSAIHTKAVVQGNTPSSRTAYSIRQILCYKGFLKVGNYVKFDGHIYLITEPTGNNQIYDQALMRHCNYNLRWLNNKGAVVERKGVYWDHTVHLAGETHNRYLVTGNMRSQFYLPKDKETMMISRDHRFLIDDYDHAQVSTPVVYKVGKLNLVEKSQDGCAVYLLTLVEDNFNETTDNRKLMIADYFPSVHSFEIITPFDLSIKVGQNIQIQFVAKINGVETNENIHFNIDDADIISVSDEGLIEGLQIGEAKIKATFFQVEKEIRVSVVDSNRVFQDTAKISFAGEPTLRIGGTKIFTANFFDGYGSIMDDTAIWAVHESDSRNIPNYIEIVSEGNNSVRLRCDNSINLLGRMITLLLTGASGMVSDSVQIELVGLT